VLIYNQLMAETDAGVRKRSRKTTVSITKAEIVKRGDKKGVKFQATGRAHTEKVYYNVEIELYPEQIANKPTDKPGVMRVEHPHEHMECFVHCTCPYFTFHNEWVLWKNGSSDLRQSENKPPYITNPDMATGVCKHLFKGLPLALRAVQKIAVG